jgi:hypothetical protein
MNTSNRAAAMTCACALLLSACSDDAPTTVLLRIERGSIEQTPAALKLWIYGDGGRYVDSQRVPEVGAPELPGEVVLYPKRADDTLRLRVDASDEAGAPVGYGATSVALVAANQTKALIILDTDKLADQDDDGVPDVIDNCVDVYNPDQAPCEVDAGPRDGGSDADASDGPSVPDASDGPVPDRGPDSVDCDEDKDGYLSVLCGGDDCNDKLKDVNPGATETGPGSAICTDGIDNDCDTKTDTGEAGCRECESDTVCGDGDACTDDRCVKNVCVNTVDVGKSCNDGDPCTKNTGCLANGGCGGGDAVTCPGPAPQCRVPACDSNQGGCVTVAGNEGGSCDDGVACTAATCQSGSCITDTSQTFCQIGGTCYADGDANTNGCVCDPAQSTSGWSPPAGGCQIGGQCYPNNATDPVSGCRCIGSQSATSWSVPSNNCEIDGKCVASGVGIACATCQPSSSKTSYTPLSACNNAIVLVAANTSYNGNLGGLSGADAKCTAAAADVGLSISLQAFIATATRDATTLVPPAMQGRKVVNGRGQTLFSSWTAMLAGGTNAPPSFYTFTGIRIDEPYGSWDDADAWTGMNTKGGHAGTALDCGGWQSSSGSGGVHELDQTGYFLAKPETKGCQITHALLCVWIK